MLSQLSQELLASVRNNCVVHMVQGKTYSYNCKVNKRKPLPREKWDIVPNTHEAIIDKNDFAKVQQLLSKKSKPKKTVNNTLPSVLAGFLVCYV